MEIHDSEMAGLQNEQYLFKLHFGGLQDVGLRQRKRQRQGAFKEHRSDVQTNREAARRQVRQSSHLERGGKGGGSSHSCWESCCSQLSAALAFPLDMLPPASLPHKLQAEAVHVCSM